MDAASLPVPDRRVGLGPGDRLFHRQPAPRERGADRLRQGLLCARDGLGRRRGDSHERDRLTRHVR